MRNWIMNEALDWGIHYFKQSSTWKGFFMTGCASLHLTLSPNAENQFVAWGLALVGFVEIVRNERTKQ